jgi:hypothetical protein
MARRKNNHNKQQLNDDGNPLHLCMFLFFNTIPEGETVPLEQSSITFLKENKL